MKINRYVDILRSKYLLISDTSEVDIFQRCDSEDIDRCFRPSSRACISDRAAPAWTEPDSHDDHDEIITPAFRAN